jgi:molybdate transport system regulatory protein
MQSDHPTRTHAQGAPHSSGGLIPTANDGSCLDSGQLHQLEQAFRQWVAASPRRDIEHSRRRILLIFLLIRYTGAKLNEVLALDPYTDIHQQQVCIRDPESAQGDCSRTIAIADHLATEIRETLEDPDFRHSLTNRFAIDPAFVRRKFYERADACGFAKQMAGPEMIRRARGVELMQSNMPLPVVQKLLGHSTPNLTAAHVSYSEEELQRVTRFFMERESCRTTSARNTFFGKISAIERGDVQAQVTMINPSGYRVTTMITVESLDRLALQVGRLVTAEVKAPWVMLHVGAADDRSSAENRFQGEVVRINRGKITAEYVVRIDATTELCAIMSTESANSLPLQVGDRTWVVFNCFAVILHD